MRAQERVPLWKLFRSYFSFGEWMRSSSSAEADEQGVEPERALEIADDRDRAARADRDGLACPTRPAGRRLRAVSAGHVVGQADGARALVRG